ncbi:MAG: DMT family transporter, partial [Deltaproteobacteria bacterium]|nr:DMT family transporter [Deltaproteobacteria bacterium]
NLDFPHAGEVYSASCALLWSIGVIYFKKSGENIAPLPLNLFKDTIGLLLFIPTMLILGIEFVPVDLAASDWIILLVSGAIGIGIADSVFFASLNRLGAGRSAVVDCLYSPFIIVCSFIYLHEDIGVGLLIALVLMTAGILIGTWNPERTESDQDRKKIRQGVLLGIIAMLLMSIGIVMAKPVLDRSDPFWASTVRLFGGVALLSFQMIGRRNRAELWRCFRPGPLWKVTLPSAVFGGYLAMIFWIAGMKYTDTTIASVLNQLSTIFVLILATLFLKESLTLRKVVAIILGFAGGVIVTF